MAKRDYYEILGAPREASMEDLKKAYRQKAKELHPDRNSDNPDAEAQFKEVNEAYDILKDPEKKAVYDRYGHAAFDGSMGGGPRGARGGQGDFASTFSDVFEDLFGDFMNRNNAGRQARAQRGSDLRYNLRITLEEAYNGAQKTITIPTAIHCEACTGKGTSDGSEASTCPTCAGHGKIRAQQGFFTIERTCPTCNGMGQMIKNPCKECGGAGRTEKQRTLSVNIPKGVETGTRIRLNGEGEAGLRGGPAGDLYLFIDTQEHNIFQRDGLHLFVRVPVPMTTAALGGEVEVPTIDGGRSRFRVPAGSQNGKQMRLRNKGMPSLRRDEYGDLMIELVVETPVNLTGRQKELLTEFEKLSEENNPEAKSFFSKVKNFWDGIKN